MKKFTLLAGVLLATVISANAQTKVSKQIKVLDWLDVAVVDGNQVAGGLHTYATWAALGTDLKLSQIQVGMLVTIRGTNATYRLKTWATPSALPLPAEWERIGDVVVVGTIALRDALLTEGHSLAVGTTVLVGANSLGIPESFIYVGGTIDVNGSGAADASDIWFSFGDDAANSGYVYYTTVAKSTVDPNTGDFSSVSLTDGFINNGSGVAISKTAIAVTDKKLSSLVDVSIPLTASATNVPVIAFPKAWAKPNFILKNGTEYTQLQDCWVLHYITKGGVAYQVWVADNTFLAGAPGGMILIVR